MKFIKVALVFLTCLFNNAYTAAMAKDAQPDTGIMQLDITKIRSIIGEMDFHPLVSDFRFDQTMPIAGLENTLETCYAASLFQAMRVTPIREFVRGKSGELTAALDNLFTAMETAKNGIDEVKVSTLLVPLLKEQSMQIRFLKDVEYAHYSKISTILGGDAIDPGKELGKMYIGNAYDTEGLFEIISGQLYEENQEAFLTEFCYHRSCEDQKNGKIAWSSDNLEDILEDSVWVPNTTRLPELIVISTDENFKSEDFEKLTGSAEFSEFLNFSYDGTGYHYRLVSAVIHHDKIPVIMPSNHDTALVWNRDNGKWYNADNEFVFYEGEFPDDFAKRYKPVVLFYQKIG